jgi:hypothetical protein
VLLRSLISNRLPREGGTRLDDFNLVLVSFEERVVNLHLLIFWSNKSLILSSLLELQSPQAFWILFYH